MKVREYAKTSDKVITRNIDLLQSEKRKDIYYYFDTEKEEGGIYLSVNNICYCISSCYNMDQINNRIERLVSFDFAKMYDFRIENDSYFNMLEIEMFTAMGFDPDAMFLSRERFQNAQKEKELKEAELKEKKRLESERLEREQKSREQKEKEEKKEAINAFFSDHADILKPDLSDFEKLTAYAELNECNYYNISGQTERLSYIQLIKEKGYNSIYTFVKKYSDKKVNGCYKELSKPKTEYYLKNESGSIYRINAKLAKVLSI